MGREREPLDRADVFVGAAFLCLPRMFQVLVVENADEGHLHTASWAFPHI